MNIKKTFLLIFSLTIAFYAIFLFYSEFSKFESNEIIFKFEYVFLIIPLIVLSWLPIYFRWRLLCKNLEISVPIKTDFLIYLSGFALTITPGKIGELLRTQLLKDKTNTSRSNTVPIIFVEKFYDLIGAILFSTIGIINFPEIWFIILGGLSLILFIYLIISTSFIFKKFMKLLTKFNFTKSFVTSLSESQSTLKRSIRPKILLLSSLLSILYWSIVSVAVYFIFQALNFTSIDIFRIVSSYVLSHFIGALSFIPGGIGVAEMSFAGFLHLNGIEFPLIATVVIISRIFTLWINIVVGFIALKFSGGFSFRELK